MNIFMLALGVFIINFTHLISAVKSTRTRLIDQYGRKRFFAVYGVASTVALLLIIFGYYERDFIVVYEPPIWGARFNASIMFLAFFMLCAQFFNGHVKRWAKAPAIVAILIWSFGHLCANGDLHSVIMFGGFLLYALTGLYFKWQRPAANAGCHYRYDIYALAVGFVVYMGVGYAHPYFAGVSIF